MDQINLDSKDPDQIVPGRDRLWVQVLIGLFFLATAIASAAGLLLHQFESANVRSNAEQNNLTKFELLQSSLAENVVSEDLPQLETTLNRLIQRDPDLHAVVVANEAGQVLFSWRRTGEAHGLVAGEHDPDLYPLSADFTFLGENFGRMTAVWNLARIRIKSERRSTGLFLFTLAVCSLLGFFAYMLVNLLAVGPINHISQRLSRFRHGDFQAKEKLPRFISAELRRLDRSADALAGFIIEREEHARQLSEARDAAESASRAKSQFLAMMSHELRTPLNAINGFSEILIAELHGPIGNREYQDCGQQIQAAGSHLLAVINDILDISKIESGQTELVMEQFELDQMIRTAVRMVDGHDILHGVEIDTRMPSDLPVIKADERRLQQVMLNLLSNAVRFTPAGGQVTVSTEWHPEQGLTIAVSDTGIGIAPENLERVLEPFSQIENVFIRRHEGTGLGLAVSKALVELHGGKLELQSELDLGTSVRLRFPPSIAPKVALNGKSRPNTPSYPAKTG